jgi:hypothetical protein
MLGARMGSIEMFFQSMASERVSGGHNSEHGHLQ